MTLDLILLFSSGLFDLFPQPVLFVQDGAAAACNAAARRIGLSAGATVSDCFGADAPLLEQTEGASALTLTLAGRRCTVTARPAAGGLLLIADKVEEETDALPAQTLLAVSLALQKPLADLLNAGGALFPAIEELEDPGLDRSAALCQRAVYQLLRLDGHLRDHGAALTEQLALRPEKTELCGFVTALCEKTESLCAELGVTLRWKVPYRQFYAWIDPEKLELAILELLSNALKYTPRGQEIRLELARLEQTAVLTLTGGEGLDDAALAQAFSQYSDVSPLRDGRKGAGLGLPLAQRLVRLHGGRLLLERHGEDAVVRLALPLGVPRDPQLRSPKRVPEPADRSAELVALSDVLPAEVYDPRNL